MTRRNTRRLAANKNRSTQLDNGIQLVIVVGILLALLLLIDFFSDTEDNSSQPNIVDMLSVTNADENSIGFVINNQIDPVRLNRFAAMDYQVLKRQLGMDKDFAITLLDSDGNVILVAGKSCIGSPKAKVAGQHCS